MSFLGSKKLDYFVREAPSPEEAVGVLISLELSDVVVRELVSYFLRRFIGRIYGFKLGVRESDFFSLFVGDAFPKEVSLLMAGLGLIPLCEERDTAFPSVLQYIKEDYEEFFREELERGCDKLKELGLEEIKKALSSKDLRELISYALKNPD